MTSQPEKLFRDKLENFQQPAPMTGWERIESNLDQKRRSGVWIKAAAAVVVLATVGIMLWPVSDSDNAQPLTRSKPEAPAVKEELPEINQPVAQATEQKALQKKEGRKNKNNAALKTESNVYPSENLPSEIPVIENTVEPAMVAVVEVNPAEPVRSKTIVYTAEEVNAKFLKKKNSAEATPEEKKSSGIQKLMGLAADLKNTENGIGDLRQKKDEILALNFLKEDKTNNEKN